MQCHLLCKLMFINYKISPQWRDFPVNVKAYSFLQNYLPTSAHFQRLQNGAEAGTNYRGPAVRRSGARLCCVCCCLSRCYHYLSCVQIIPVRPSPSYTAYESQSFRFTAKMFSWSFLAGGGGGVSTRARTRSRRPCVRYPISFLLSLSYLISSFHFACLSLIISICPSHNHSSPPTFPLYHLYCKTV